MKNQIKTALLTVAVAVAAFTSQAAYNGDLILGFTVQSGNDLEFDLGKASTLVNGKTWNVSSLLTAQALNTGSVKWGVIGTITDAGVKQSFATIASGLPGQINGNTAYQNINSQVTAMGTLFGVTPFAEGVNLAPSSTLANSWNKQTASLGGGYFTYGGNPNSVGYDTVNFYKTLSNNTAPSLVGTFSFADTGIVTFNAVPEPATYGALAGAGLLIVSLRNQFRRKQA